MDYIEQGHFPKGVVVVAAHPIGHNPKIEFAPELRQFDIISITEDNTSLNVPIYWDHDPTEEELGQTLTSCVDDKGRLVVVCELYLLNPRAAEVFKQIKDGTLFHVSVRLNFLEIGEEYAVGPRHVLDVSFTHKPGLPQTEILWSSGWPYSLKETTIAYNDSKERGFSNSNSSIVNNLNEKANFLPVDKHTLNISDALLSYNKQKKKEKYCFAKKQSPSVRRAQEALFNQMKGEKKLKTS